MTDSTIDMKLNKKSRKRFKSYSKTERAT